MRWWVHSKQLLWSLPAVLWTALVFYLTLVNAQSLPQRNWMQFWHLDKAVHGFLFCMLFLFYYIALRKAYTARNVIGMSCVLAIVVGIVTEMLQWAVAPSRHFDLLDLMANITGVAIAALFIKKVN